ncbi:FtsX-like permease family protein [Lacticaseibacillus jixiensis]|uniref:FtsX-like permease family protein n=1 Tax=Lacticaseibacillus jixiensis TaxID=3231926 RepID=UPI0036F245FD
MWQLTRTNLLRHRGMHVVFAVILGILVTVVYAIAALATNAPLLTMLSKGVGHRSMFTGGLLVVLWVLAAFCLVFMGYLNSLLMQRRHGEFGLYRRLGMPTGRLGVSLALELFISGLWGLAGGLIGGIVFSKLLAMVLLRLCDINAQVGLLISGSALLEVSIGVALGLGLLGALRIIGVCGRDLTRFRHVNDIAINSQAPGALMKIGAVGGVLLLVAATSVIIQLFVWFSRLTATFGGTIGLGVLLLALLGTEICGVYLLYAASLPTLVHSLMQTTWAQIARRQLMLSRLYVRLRANRQSLWLTTWLTTVTLVILGAAAMFYQYGMTVVDQDVPMAVVASTQGRQRIAKQLGAKPPQVRLTTKLASGHVQLKMRNGRDAQEKSVYQVLSQSAYRRIQQKQPGLADIDLTGQAAVLLTVGQTYYQTATWSNIGRQVTLNASDQHFTIKALSNVFPLGGALYFDRGLVVSDAAYARLEAPKDVLFGFAPSAKRLAAVQKALSAFSQRSEYVAIDGQTLAGKRPLRIVNAAPKAPSLAREALSLRKPAMHEMHVVFGFVLFVLGLLGAVMLVATASIMLLKQLATEFGSTAQRQILLRLGMPRSDVAALRHMQVMAVFGLPWLIGSINAAIGIHLLQVTLDGTSNRFVLIAFAVYTVVYLGFAAATATKGDHA